jgi:hypothetical protein
LPFHGLGAEGGAETAEAGDDLVGDEEDVVLLQHRLDLPSRPEAKPESRDR